MILHRLRAYFKEHLPRTSASYRIARFTFQNLGKLRNIVSPPPPPRHIEKSSIFEREDELPMCSLFPKEELELTIELFQPKTLLDVGCGTGMSMDYFRKHGVNVFGIEGSQLARSKARRPDLIQIGDLHTQIDLNRQFDVVWCFEVAEHIHPDFAETLTGTIGRHGNVVVLSAAQPGQGGCGHLNEQPPEYWIDQFLRIGFHLDEVTTSKFHSLEDQFAPNILVFRRNHSSQAKNPEYT